MVVAGAHTVTLVNKVLVEGVVVPLSVVTAATFGPAPEGSAVISTDAVEPEFKIEVAVRVTGALPDKEPGAV